MPLADAARRLDVSCGKRPAALPPAHGASPRLSGQTLARRREGSLTATRLCGTLPELHQEGRRAHNGEARAF